MSQKCEHAESIKENGIPPQKTNGCEECKKEGMNRVAIRMCLTCGHLGCCDSSKGLYARKHFENTNHQVMIQLPKKSWKWCYIHELYNRDITSKLDVLSILIHCCRKS